MYMNMNGINGGYVEVFVVCEYGSICSVEVFVVCEYGSICSVWYILGVFNGGLWFRNVVFIMIG